MRGRWCRRLKKFALADVPWCKTNNQNKANEEFSKAEKELKDAKQKLDSSKKQLESTKKSLQTYKNELIANKKLFLRKEQYYHRIINRYYLTTIPQFKFSIDELGVINKSIDKLSENNASTITKYAIKDPPLHIADFGDVIDYRYVFCRNDNYSFIKE